MIGRADIEGSKSNVAMNARRHKPLIPVVTFLDTSSFKFRRSKGSIGHAFTGSYSRRSTPEEGPRKSRSKSVPDSTRWPALAAEQLEQPAKKLDGFGLGPRAHPLVANPFPGLRSILPTSLPTFFHRPQVVHLGDPMRMSTTGANDTLASDFQGPPGRTDTTNVQVSSSSPDPTSAEPSRFQGGQVVKQKDNSSRGPRRRLRLPNVAVNRRVPAQNFNPIPFRSSRETRFFRTGLPRLLDRLTHVQVPFTWNLSPLRPSKFSFEYLLLPPRSAPTEAPPARALGFTNTAAPSYSSGA
ncbi:hypothetical protein Syun_031945 [Stephania yunnanensis]|uniref:Uncharacterized protein n=1 Tax=Stephania yunnanensis TaxID=152371 RepID=A0AAP0HFF7_9MAGN